MLLLPRSRLGASSRASSSLAPASRRAGVAGPAPVLRGDVPRASRFATRRTRTMANHQVHQEAARAVAGSPLTKAKRVPFPDAASVTALTSPAPTQCWREPAAALVGRFATCNVDAVVWREGRGAGAGGGFSRGRAVVGPSSPRVAGCRPMMQRRRRPRAALRGRLSGALQVSRRLSRRTWGRGWMQVQLTCVAHRCRVLRADERRRCTGSV